jgi:hypothetical protein
MIFNAAIPIGFQIANKKTRRSSKLKGLLEDGGRTKFFKNLRTSPLIRTWPLWSPPLIFCMDFRSRAFSLTTLVLLANALLVLLSDFLTTFSGQAGFS